jgi:group I intron endonuclease
MRCIYRIDINDKYYIGSAKNLKSRKRNHLSKMRLNSHYNSHLQNLYNKYGEQSIKFSIIEEIDDTVNLFSIEQKYLDEHIENDKCVNISPIAGGGKLYTPTPETINKGLETKRKTGNWGTNHGDNSAAVAANTGSKRSKEFCEKQADLMKDVYKKDKEKLKKFKKAAAKGRENRWAAYDKPFILIKNGVEYGPYRTQTEVSKSKILSYVSISRLFLGKLETVKGFSLKFIKETK